LADAVPFEIPASENWQEWESLLTQAGFRYVRSTSASPSVRLRAGVKWTLEVRDELGQKKIATLDVAESRSEREAVVWIARSLLGAVELDPLEPLEPPPAENEEVETPEGLRPFVSLTGGVGVWDEVAVLAGGGVSGGVRLPFGLQAGAGFSGRGQVERLLTYDLVCADYIPFATVGYRNYDRPALEANVLLGAHVRNCLSYGTRSVGALPWGAVDIGVGWPLGAGFDVQAMTRAGIDAGTLTFDKAIDLPIWTLEAGLRVSWAPVQKKNP